MRKLLLTIIAFLICSTAHATVYYACTGGGTWSSATGVWVTATANQATCSSSSGPPGAADTATLNSASGNITIGGATSVSTLNESGYTGTLAFGTQTLTVGTTAGSGVTLQGVMSSTSGTIIVKSGGVTLDGTVTGSFPLLEPTTANQQLTSNGYTWPGAFAPDITGGAGTITLLGNWVNGGLFTLGATTFINSTTNETMTLEGGITISAAGIEGSATIIFTGGTFTQTVAGDIITNNFTITPSFANITIASGSYLNMNSNSSGTLTYTASTNSVTTTGSTLETSGTTGTLTLNTNGINWNNITFTSATTVSMSSNLTANGLVTFSGATILDETNSSTLTANAGLTMSSPSGASPTATIILAGGTWTGSSAGFLTNNLTLAGNVALANSVNPEGYETGTLTYSSGTITVTGSILNIEGSATLNTSGMTWNTVELIALAPETLTLSSNLSATTLEMGFNIVDVIVGSHNITVANLLFSNNTNNGGLTFPAGQTITVTSSIIGCFSNYTGQGGSVALKSGTTSSPLFLDYTGTAANELVCGMYFTDVDASGSSEAIFNYKGETLTRTKNIINVSQNNLGGDFIE